MARSRGWHTGKVLVVVANCLPLLKCSRAEPWAAVRIAEVVMATSDGLQTLQLWGL